ncbi:hypothetical protein DFO48_10567, partial [Comamonas sp. AG1104]
IGMSAQCSRKAFGNVSAVSGLDGYLGSFPSVVDNGLHLSAIHLTDGPGAAPSRGVMPGAYHCPQTNVLAAMGGDVSITHGQGAFLGRKLLSFATGFPSISVGVGFLDVRGPWRT